jgi:hypothetical protein
MSEHSDWFEESWRYRDEVLYPAQLGGDSTGSINTIPYEAFARMGFDQIDPRWLYCGILTFPPTGGRTQLIFVTSGLSNAWDDDAPDQTSISGLGIELRLDSPTDDFWAKDVLLRLSAMQLLIHVGRIAGARVLDDGDRVLVGEETFGDGSAMTSLLATEVADLRLPTGRFKMIQLFPITDAERQYAGAKGAEALLGALRQNTTYPVSDLRRSSVV